MIKIQQIVKPFNSGFSAVSIKYLLEDLQKRYLQNIKPDLVCKVIKIKNDYFVYFQIPSESNSEYPSDKVHYDVILQLVPPNASWLESENLRDFDVRVYSNCPSFTFTFTYVYYKQGALINMPHGAYTRKALNTKPVTRNPLLLYGIEKSLWFAICYMDENHLFRRSKLDAMITDDKTLKDLVKEYNMLGQDEKLLEVERRAKKHAVIKLKEREEKISESRLEEMRRQEQRNTRVLGKTAKREENIDNLRSKMAADLSSGLNTAKDKKNNLGTTTLHGNSLRSGLSKLFKRKK
jgi:hypothetical protein